MADARDVSRRDVMKATAAAAAMVAAAATPETARASDDVPAVAGGKPLKTTPFAKEKRYGDAELAQLREALDQQTLFYAQGKKVKQLEADFAKQIGAKF